MMRMRSEFKNKLNKNKVQFARIRDKNVNFVLCQFQNRNSKHSFFVNTTQTFETHIEQNLYVSLRLCVQNAVSTQPCVGKFRISLVLLNFLHCNFRLWFKTT